MEVDLLCIRSDREEESCETLNGVRVRRLRLVHRRGGKWGYLYRYSAFIALSTLIVAFRSLFRRYDLVYVHNMPDVLVVVGIVPRLGGARVILDLHDPMPELMMTIFGLDREARSVRLLKVVEKWSMARADRVVTVNRACETLFSSRSCRLDKITVVMNSPDEAIFGDRRPDPGSHDPHRPFVLMYHGSLVERNGLGLAVDALARVRAELPQVELRVYGGPENPFLEAVMASARRQGVADAIRYMGPRSIEGIAEAIEECDAGVVPNQRNVFTELNTPTRIFEYLAKGKPVIAPRAGGVVQYFDESSLFLFELGDADDLADQIRRLVRDPGEAASRARRGWEVYRAHRWSAERERLRGLVAELLTGRGVVPEARASASVRRP
jgi:glycosyltransferase involved in cell wall biosynthesis